jgi:hypothetical protein
MKAGLEILLRGSVSTGVGNLSLCETLPNYVRSGSPTSVQFKGEINGALPCKRHQKGRLEFCDAYLLSRRSPIPDLLIVHFIHPLAAGVF